tara:strand:- start:13867 stop:15777 length:1911 start_codon:yes stop_codon:yes gene_type:complete
MTARRPLVTKDGFITELPAGDTVSAGSSSSNVVAGSGLIGGGSLHENPEIDIALPPNPSGLIFVGDALGNDGYAQATADTALASGVDAGTLADTQVVSGNAALFTAVSALGSGNAALELIPNLVGGGPFDTFTAAGTILSGMPVGVDDTGRVQAVAVDQILNDDLVVSSGRILIQDNDQLAQNRPCYIGTYGGAQKVLVNQERYTVSTTNQVSIITISGTTSDLITRDAFASQAGTYAYQPYSCYLPNLDKIVTVFRDSSPTAGTFGFVSVVNTTNGRLTNGAVSSIQTGGTHNDQRVVHVSGTNEVHITFRQQNNYPSYERYRVNDNNTLSVLYQSTIQSSAGTFGDLAYLEHAGTSINVFRGASNYFYAVTLSGNTIGTPVALTNERADWPQLMYFPNINKCVATTDLFSSSSGVAFVLEPSGNTIVRGPFFPLLSGSENQTGYSMIVPLNDTPNRGLAFVNANFTDAPTTNSRTQLVEISGMTILPVEGRNLVNGEQVSAQYSSGPTGAFIPELNRPFFVGRRGTTVFQTYAVGTEEAIVQNPIPTRSGLTNYMGVSQETVSSGDSVLVALPGFMHVGEDGEFSAGSSYYLDPENSGLSTSTTNEPRYWDGEVAWNRVGQGVSSSGIMLLNSL